jgi:hypothetical protein
MSNGTRRALLAPWTGWILTANPAVAGAAPQDLKGLARKFTEHVYNQQHRQRIPV